MTSDYHKGLQQLLDDIHADETLSVIDRLRLLDVHSETVKASLRQARKLIRGDGPAISPALEGQARKAIRRLVAEGKNPREMSDSQLLATGGVGVSTLEAIRAILKPHE